MSTHCIRLFALALSAHVAFCLTVESQNGGPLRSEPQRDHGVSLLQRWATANAPHHLELRDEDLTTYIATGKLPEQSLSQLHSSLSDYTDPTQPTAEQQKQDKKYVDDDQKALSKMKSFEGKLDMMRNTAEAGFEKVKAQESRLIANFVPVSKLLVSLVDKASDAASKAEANTMISRMERVHFKQISALDRSASYWAQMIERENEARRVAENKLKVLTQKVGFSPDEAHKIFDATTKRNQEKAQLEGWFEQFWSQIEEKEKNALQSNTPFDAGTQQEVLSMLEQLGSTKHLSEHPQS